MRNLNNEITNYIKNDNGTYDVQVTNVILTDEQIKAIDKGGLPINLSAIDPHRMTERQRGFIFALVNDIEVATGQEREFMRYYFQDYVQFINGYENKISLSNCSKSVATKIIDTILVFMFKHNIPINYKTSMLMRNDQSFLYLATIKRKCVICGKSNSDLAHHYHIGRGMNRQKMNHYGYEVLALCREHHNLQHQMGVTSFDKYYQLKNSWIKVDERINKMLKGQQIEF